MRSHRLRMPARFPAALILSLGLATLAPPAARADDAQTQRGKYIVSVAGCGDCHTPGTFIGKPDPTRFLGGSDVAFEIPGLGAFAGANITPDMETGIGKWTPEQIIAAFQTGVTPAGKILAPIMPWKDFANLSPDDAMAVAMYLKSIPPVSQKVPGPFKPGDKTTMLMYRILPPGETVASQP